jgi:two-component system, chemotaxis family, chemotaxis protein CheY
MARIMVVDDNAFMRNNLKNVLKGAGFDVCAEASDGVEAVATYQTAKPDLVTMDITMPNMDGVQALKELKGLDPTAKVIMVSAMGQEALVVEAITSGAADFVVKPFEATRVVEAVNNALAA